MKNVLILISALLMILLVNSSEIYSQDNSVFQDDEFLKYEVSFLGITLGWITVESEEETEFQGNKVFKANALMDSRDGIPFVDLYAKFNAMMDPSLSYSQHFTSVIKDGPSSWLYDKYDIRYDDKVIKYTKWKDKVIEVQKEIPISKKVADGTTLFFLARKFTNMKRTVNIPTLINDNLYNTKINFHGREEGVKIDAIDYEVKTLFFDGIAEWEGIYGLNGKFKGWFSADDARVPIKAQMNVYVGSVDITLVEWRRKGWTAPKM